ETAATGYALKENWRVDPTLYPDLAQLATDLHAQGLSFLTYHNTFLDETADVYAEATGAGYAIHDDAGATLSFTGVKFSPSTMLDLSNPAAVTWAKGVMSEGIALGVDGWMADFAEWLPTTARLASGEDAMRAHQKYPVEWARLNHDLLAPSGGLYFMRSAWLHSQPLVQVLWPGDQQTDWSEGDGLPSVIPMGIGLGLTGFPYFGSDIAGYMSQGTTPTDEELFYRWTTFGALQPVMRTHHGRSAHDNFQWEHDAASIAHLRKWSRLHAQLAAYLWGSIGTFERDGLPLIRLVALGHPDEAWAWTAVDEYELGDRILVAPVQTPGATSREVMLPAGTWYPLLGGPAVQGGKITAPATKADLPAYVPAGTLLVLYPDGVETSLPTTGRSVAGDDREVWLWAGEAAKPAVGTWHDETGAAGSPQWTWRGRAATAGAPTTATFAGAVVTATAGAFTVVGDGTLELAGGGTLVIARGKPTATTIVKLR
ncbi:MAG: hypothetical protein NT062_00965, partial [Proteobacteria bacterium]|nr:hypothetical protein [Pseudomonadota bacterium]